MDDSKMIDELIGYANELQEREPDNTFYVVELNDPHRYEVVSEHRDSGREMLSIDDPEIENWLTRIVFTSGE